jgi:hypothetical protein
MRIQSWLGVLALCALGAAGAERRFDFSELREGETPPGFRSVLMGEGKPGQWQIVLDSVPSLMPALTPQAPAVAKRPVLAQLARDAADEHFPLLIFEDETFNDFTLTTRFKTVAGTNEQMAGIAFRIQNETNYYVVRASSLGDTFRFYKVLNGVRGNILGPSVHIESNVWHELTVKCKGNQIDLFLDGRQAIPTLTDTSFSSGKIGFWTKSDSVSYFADTRITYTPREPAAQALVLDTLKKNPRLLGLKVFVAGAAPETTRLVASNDPKELGQAGDKAEADVIKRGVSYYLKEKDAASVTLPMRDRNGDPIAAVRVVMATFAGQTEQNAVVRATPIVKQMESQVQTLRDLVE